MKSTEFKTVVKDIITRSYNMKSFRFVRPSSFNYKPGQFMFITIKPGKEEMKKHFTISTSPTEKNYIEFTKKLTGHEFSNALDTLKLGDLAKIDGPYGNFTLEEEFEKICMISGGIGVTPFRSMCKYYSDLNLETKITLLYSSQNEKEIVFLKEFEEMQIQNKNLKVIFSVGEVIENWVGRRGRITAEMVQDAMPDYMERIIYICGPPGMVTAMDNSLNDLGIPQKQVKKENFSGY